jgi:hypothetical protein
MAGVMGSTSAEFERCVRMRSTSEDSCAPINARVAVALATASIRPLPSSETIEMPSTALRAGARISRYRASNRRIALRTINPHTNHTPIAIAKRTDGESDVLAARRRSAESVLSRPNRTAASAAKPIHAS